MTAPDPASPNHAFPDPAGEAAWRAAVAKVLKGEDAAERLVGRTLDGIPVAPLYPPAAAPGPSGARPPCTVAARLDADEVSPLDDVENGADALVLVFAGAGTARGFGLEPAALAPALEGVAIAHLPLRLEPAPYGGLEAVRALLELADARRVDAAALDLDAGIDPLGAMARTGEAPEPWRVLSGLVAEVVAAVRGRGLAGPLLLADGRPHHEAGASEAQELAAVLGTGLAYLRLLEAAGTPLDAARRSLSFLLPADADKILTIAKFRALRRLWARVEADCGLDPAPIRLQAETSWRMLARRDPPTNLLRNALAVAGAMLGGADGVTVLPHTAALGLPEAGARRLARNTALVLRDEAGLDRVADPAAGAGAFEALTEGLCAAAWDVLAATERAGGLPAALADGSWALRLAVTQGRRIADFASGARTLVGTTAYPLDAEPPPAVLRPMPRAAPRAPAALPCLRDDQLVGPEGALP
ncbi:methylmalonyl-CoA mutase family protein [Lichenibacterium ramalinae]|uniref:Methylmalonyl-CoA mutase n=1 Tax=Lichenibacterium ramalinae TaxID=2316527 RepID=A0A4Q2R5W6_9HYPH|nr:methylmalonyl-CoA mutase family protein [Lichenibacterium ramalinae]RYB01956.1 methylmalonyl-CoA mutase [Lichenibacterium ramalinae]